MINLDTYYAFKDITFTYQVTLYILSIGLFITSLEDLKTWSVFQSKGILSWKVSKLGLRYTTKSLIAKLLNFCLNDKAFKGSIYLRIFGAILLFIFSVFNIISPSLLIALFFFKILIALRSPYGLDGAYQMHLVILFALSIGSLCGICSKISIISLCFIAGELVISYFISGITKLTSPAWRKSFALNAIFSTRTYGHSLFFRLISQRNVLATSMSWMIFLFETLFFLVIFLHPMHAIVLLVTGLLFHLFNAVFMGLNDFLFAFSAAYPALIYCIHKIHLN